VDNLSQIVENTRTHYSRSSAEVETEIATGVTPPPANPPTPIKTTPPPSPDGHTAPVNLGALIASAQAAAAANPQPAELLASKKSTATPEPPQKPITPTVVDDESLKAKRKRVRGRRKNHIA